MSEEVDLAVIQQTQETLGKYIKKPPLSEKLLKKPPFRFLHDVVKEVSNINEEVQSIEDCGRILNQPFFV